MNRTDFVYSYQELLNYLVSQGVQLDRAHLKKVDHPFPLVIPHYYLNLIQWYDPADPLRLMVLTDAREHEVHSYEIQDPIGDTTHAPVPGIVHRYPDRCLLMLTNACAVHCRFCFRKSLLHTQKPDARQSIEYIKAHPEIWEVILSGGDPFVLTDHFLQSLLSELRAISHIKMIRFHTRTPAVYPARITESFINVIAHTSPVCVVIHINHPREITPEFQRICEQMRKSGIMLLSQTVLMRQVNDDVATLSHLFKSLVESGVKPYYLHHLDYAHGTHHFRTSIRRGKELVEHLRGRISGLCIPEYILDIPGGKGKIPVSWLKTTDHVYYTGTTFSGEAVSYHDPLG